MDSSLDVTECSAPINSSVTFPATLPSCLSKEEKVIDASSINHSHITSIDPSLDVTEYPAPVNGSVTFPAPPPSLLKEGKVIDASSINHYDTTSTDRSLVPLSAEQQASEVVAMSSEGSLQGNDTSRLRCPASSVLKEGKMIDISCVNCQSLSPYQYCHEGAHRLCDMPHDTSNIKVAKEPSQLPTQPSLLEVPMPTMPTTAVVVPLELSPQVQ
jgi:hypothetical protein